jgi:hypothetical protein
VVEQLAGDELVPRPWANLKADQIELLAATGFPRAAPDGTTTGATDAEQVVTDVLKVVSSSLLGSSVGCAQCHDHRYDPIPQRDYYELRAIFEPALDPGKWRKPAARLVSLYTDADRAKAAASAEADKMQTEFNEKQRAAVRAAFEKELEKFPEAERDALKAAFDAPDAKRTAEQKKLVASNPKLNVTPGTLYQYNQKASDELKAEQTKIAAKRAERPAEGFVAVTAEVPGRVPETKLYHRGDARQPKGPALAPADLTVAAPEGKRFNVSAKGAPDQTTGRRLAWAEHLTNGAHPLHRDGLLAAGPSKPGENPAASLAPRAPHFAPKAKAMISLFMHGGPSHVDLFDPKPELTKNSGTEYAGNVQYSFVNRASKKLFGSPWKFAKRGKCGTEVSELLPHTAGLVDDIAVVRSMHTGANGHEVSIRYFHGGIAGVTGRPTMGSWIVYGLGSEAQNLPAYMVLSDPAGPPVDAAHNWNCGFLPPLY